MRGRKFRRHFSEPGVFRLFEQLSLTHQVLNPFGAGTVQQTINDTIAEWQILYRLAGTRFINEEYLLKIRGDLLSLLATPLKLCTDKY
jgi:hypothetical protein